MSEPILTEQNLLDAINYMRSAEHRKQQEEFVENNQELIGEVFYGIRVTDSMLLKAKRKIKQLKLK